MLMHKIRKYHVKGSLLANGSINNVIYSRESHLNSTIRNYIWPNTKTQTELESLMSQKSS